MDLPNIMMTGKVALITGGRTGLGKAFALAFAKAGADVAICSRTDKDGELQAVASEIRRIGRRALAIRADVTRRADVDEMVKKTVAELGDIDTLINNAGITACVPFLEMEESTWDQVININLKSCYLCSQAVGREMAQRKRGNIINISSTGGLRALPNFSVYDVTKAGVIMLTRVLAREFGSYNIRVNAIAPWAVKTQMTEQWRGDPEWVKTALSGAPLGRFGETGDIAGVALFLASDMASWITGHTIVADGGTTA